MIDIAFADSEAGMLLLSGLVEHRNLVAPWIHMEMGNLHPGCQSDERLREIHSWFKDPFLSDALFTEEVLREQMNKLFLVLTRAQEGETIRIWYDHTPEMFCGFAYVVYLVSRMENCKAKILSVCFNEHVELSARFDRLAQISPSDCEELVSVERCLTIEERTEIAQKWSELCKQDYPLRTVIGGEIVGVPINYYDGMIKESIPSNKRFTVFDIIKKVLPRRDSPDYFILMWRTACVLKELDVEAGFRTTYLPEPPDAIIVTHGLLVGSALRAIDSRGLRIPEDIALIGYMSDWVSDVMSPRVSFVKQNQREIGTKAFKLLFDQLNGDTCVQHVIVKARLELRESTR